jgi:hypothetical protein
MYWIGEPSDAWTAFTREFAAMAVRDVLSEDRDAIEASQQGLSALDEVFFQEHEVLLRHLYNEVGARVRAHQAARPGVMRAA